MRFFILVLISFLLFACESDPIRDKKRKSDKWKLLAIIGQNSEVRISVSVKLATYNQYNIHDTYTTKGYDWQIVYKRAEAETYYFDLMRTQRNTGY